MTEREHGSALEFHITARKNWFLLIFLPVWLVGWTAGGVAVIAMSVRGDNPMGGFLALWLALWIYGECFTFYVLGWTAFGKEIISTGPSVLSVRRDILGLGRTREFVVGEISQLRAAGLFGARYWSYGMAAYGLSPGTVAFNYRGKTHRFGIQLEEHEARSLVERLRRHLPRHVVEGQSSP